MSDATITLSANPNRDDELCCDVEIHDADLIGHEATLTLRRVVHVKDDRPVHGQEELWQKAFSLKASHTRFTLSRSELGRGYAYAGVQIDMRLETELKVDDGILFDTKIQGIHRLKILDRPEIDGKAKEWSEPADLFSYFANLKAIPPHSRMITLGLTLIGGMVILINALVGLHDQFTPEAQTLFYSHLDGEGDGQSPLMNSLMGSGAAGAAIWMAIRSQLRKYMSFELNPRVPDLKRDVRIQARDLIKGRSRVPLERVTVRVVAYNRELGQYIRGSGTQQRTVSFATPARAVILYEKFLPHVPARAPLESYLDGRVEFRELFAALYPPFKLGSSHGIDVCWEVQLLHPDFVDQEIQCTSNELAYEDFLDA
jgi:hypothetical protein